MASTVYETEICIDDFNLANKLDCYIHLQLLFYLSRPNYKRLRFEACIIPCSDGESLLISPEDIDTWKSLLKASTIRNHRLLLELAARNEKSPMSVIIGYAIFFL